MKAFRLLAIAYILAVTCSKTSNNNSTTLTINPQNRKVWCLAVSNDTATFWADTTIGARFNVPNT